MGAYASVDVPVSSDLALDFGTSVTRLADEHATVVFEEPTVTAVEIDSGRLLAFGNEAQGLGARSAGRVQLVRPVRNGQLVDLALAEAVLNDALRRSGISRAVHPKVLVCAHVGATGVQRRAVHRALKRAGARQVQFVEQPVACAIGAEIAIEEPNGVMVVDVGGGTTDVAVLALGGVIASTAVLRGAEDLDAAVRDHLIRRYELVVDLRVAGRLRRQIGTVATPNAAVVVDVAGRDAKSGTVRSVEIGQPEITDVLDVVLAPVFAAAVDCISSTPPDIANDLLGTGLVLAGGGSKLDGFAQRLAGATGVPVHVSDHPERLAVIGAARCLRTVGELHASISSAPLR